VGAPKKTLKELMKTTPLLKNDDTDWLNEPIDVRNI
jgi:hypothetical protein